MLSYQESEYLILYSDVLRAERPGFPSWLCKIFLFSAASITTLGIILFNIKLTPETISRELKRQKRKADHSPTSSA
jgi:hypothetical protein